MSSSGPFYKTPINDYFLDIINLPEIEQDPNDEFYVIEPKYEFRPDLLAHHLYGSTGLWYIFTLRNMDKISDPIFDFKSGLEIRLPSPNVARSL